MKKENKRILMMLISAVIVLAVISSAGCTDDSSQIQTSPVEVPDDLNAGLNDIIVDLTTIYDSINSDIADLAEKIGEAKSESEIRDISLEYYAENPMINSLIYCDESGKSIDIPVLVDSNLTEYISFPTETKLKENNGRIHLSGVFIPDYGYVDADFRAVYDKNGNYKGFILIISDLYLSLNLHPELTSKEKLYGDFICFIVDENGNITFSSSQETIGLQIQNDEKFTNGICVISKENEDSGAYKYTSRAFYNYLRDKTSEKVTAWKKMNANGAVQTVYLVKEIDKPEIQYEDLYEISTEEGIKNAEDLYVLAHRYGVKAAIDGVSKGDYGYNIYIMDMEGNVLSSPFKELIGLNYLNNRGINGYSYIGGAINTAKQGVGYIYYIYPIDGTVNCHAGQCSFAYILPIDDDCFIFSHFPGITDNIKTGSLMRTGLTETARNVLRETNDKGIEEVINIINSDPENAVKYFSPDVKIPISDIIIMDYSSVMHASAKDPDSVGKSYSRYTDLYGGSTVRKAIMLARNGSGFMPDLSASTTKEGCVDMWTICVIPVNDEYMINVIAFTGINEDILSPYI